MITGFNTDVSHEGRVYHVQTEDRGTENPCLESLVYVGGTIIAKKRTSYKDELGKGVTDDMIASRLKRQHQVIIAAIKAGRIEDLIRLSTRDSVPSEPVVEKSLAVVPATPEPLKYNTTVPVNDQTKAPPVEIKIEIEPAARVGNTGSLNASNNIVKQSKSGSLNPGGVKNSKSGPLNGDTSRKGKSGPLINPIKTSKSGPLINPVNSAKSGPLINPINPARSAPLNDSVKVTRTGGLSDSVKVAKSGSLNLDEVISDYLRRSSQQEKLDLKVITPSVFIAGKDVNLRIQVTQGAKPDTEAVVTVKIIGTAFKPQVYIGRTTGDGVASFNLHLPAFSAGTAAIVIEAQSGRGRGELKQLIRRA
jgi:hypothetical protein